MPAVSVIIPAYNSENFIRETLDSIIGQSLKDIEVIAVNDGSTDSTGNIIREYSEKYPFIRCIDQPNAGVSAARNKGISLACGDYVVFLDADDLFTEGSLEAFYNTAVSTGADCVMGRLRYFDENGMGKYHPQSDSLANEKTVSVFDRRLLWNFLVGNKCYKREALLKSKAQFPPFTFSEEGAFFMSFVYSGVKLSGTAQSCMLYRLHTKKQGLSASQTVTKNSAYNMLCSLNAVLEGAKTAVKNGCPDPEGYIQEIYLKTAHILVNQFYRLMWRSDGECRSYVISQLKKQIGLMNPDTFARLRAMNPDIGFENLEADGSSARVMIVLKPCSGADVVAAAEYLYSQTCPQFRLVISESSYEKLPDVYRKDNITVLPDSGFIRAAKKLRPYEFRVFVSGRKTLEPRVIRLAVGFKRIPAAVRRRFFPFLVFAADIILKLKGGK